MTMMRLPVFTWMTLVTSFLIILAFPAITIALVEVMLDRHFGTNFFEVSNGGMPILWQHLFWVFGHPEVYILILPAMGIVSEILPTFSRKPLFGYPIVVFSGASIGFLGFAVWSHHMFTTGMGTVATAAFALATMAIAVPTGVKIFNWIGTLWGGHLKMRTPMMFALGFIWMFMIGGFSGIMHAAAPADAQQQDSYFVVAHFHYVLIGGSIFALLAGIHYWFPLIFGRKVSEFWGKLSFWVIFVGFNITFFPMHFLGLNGMPAPHLHLRRQHGLEHRQLHRHHRRPHPRRRHRDLLRGDDLHLLQGRARRPRPVGRPHAGVVHPESAAGVQLSPSSRPSTPATPGGMRSTTRRRSSRRRPSTPRPRRRTAASTCPSSPSIR